MSSKSPTAFTITHFHYRRVDLSKQDTSQPKRSYSMKNGSGVTVVVISICWMFDVHLHTHTCVHILHTFRHKKYEFATSSLGVHKNDMILNDGNWLKEAILWHFIDLFLPWCTVKNMLHCTSTYRKHQSNIQINWSVERYRPLHNSQMCL